MSSDDDEAEGETGKWMSRPPMYRSTTLTLFLNKLDKRCDKNESSANKRWKRKQVEKGAAINKEPLTNTPKWTLSDEWKDIIERRKNPQGEEEYKNDVDAPEMQEEEDDADSSGSELSDLIEFE
ncbi:uncharacterized protein LOC122954828 [Acropora millepora]|uniref:uncharacterized protein LOC122954828 n=1 Tax=Acropora millepora TaxID=45264 RepID=UPI001CF1A779|nr:uncharacterized protein LOC122954828 [Acropora millepora]